MFGVWDGDRDLVCQNRSEIELDLYRPKSEKCPRLRSTRVHGHDVSYFVTRIIWRVFITHNRYIDN